MTSWTTYEDIYQQPIALVASSNGRCINCFDKLRLKLVITCCREVALDLNKKGLVPVNDHGLFVDQGTVHGYTVCSQCYLDDEPKIYWEETFEHDGLVIHQNNVYRFCYSHQSP